MQKKKLKELNEQENIIDKLAPKGSKRRVVVNICTQVYTHPKQILHYMKHQKIKRVFYYLFHDGIRGVSKVLDDRMLMGSDLKLELL